MCCACSNAGSCDELFSVEIHHDGVFCGVGKNRIYIDDKVDWFDFCESDTHCYGCKIFCSS